MKRPSAFRAFAVTFCVTAVIVGLIEAGLIADYRTRRMCDGSRAEGLYADMAAAVRLSSVADGRENALPDLPDELLSAAETPTEFWPRPLRVLWDFGHRLELILCQTPPRSAEAEAF